MGRNVKGGKRGRNAPHKLKMRYKIKIKIKDRLTKINLEINLKYNAKNQIEALRKGNLLAKNICNIEEYEIIKETPTNKNKVIFTYKTIKEKIENVIF